MKTQIIPFINRFSPVVLVPALLLSVALSPALAESYHPGDRGSDKQVRDSKDSRDSRDSRSSRDSQSSRDNRGSRDSQNTRDSQNSRDSRDFRDNHDNRNNPPSRDSKYTPSQPSGSRSWLGNVKAELSKKDNDRHNDHPTTTYTSKPNDRQNNYYHNDTNYRYKPGSDYSVGYKPAPSYRPLLYTDSKTVYRHGSHSYVPKGYAPPAFREGHYYYAAHHPKPCYYGYWTFDYYPGFSRKSLYYHYGLFPYIQVDRIIEISYTKVSYTNATIYTSDGYYLSSDRYAGLDDALSDIRSAWISGRFDLIENHVRDGRDIAVLLDGNYDYSIEGSDYLSMTRDALDDMQTDSFVWDKVRERTDGMVTAFGTHRYISSSGDTRTIYVSYTLQRIGRQYYITEVGSSSYRLD